MPLSRLENFLKNAEGNILYVNPSDFDATDSFENRGNSLTRPFKTIQRALLEAARFSYVPGRNNDLIDRTTILVYPGTHYVDNRPGFSIESISNTAVFKQNIAGSWTTSGATITEISALSNFDIFDPNNDLYKFNSIYGGVILPRGTSIVGLDLRKTKIRPLYVPDPYNDSIAKSAIFRVTGTCYFSAFSIFDADPSKPAYKDQSGVLAAPTFSHHKLTCFEYADGLNAAALGSNYTATISDLAMYYYKISFAYGNTSNRAIPDYPGSVDFEPSIDEFRIVGDLRANPIGISSIKAGNGVTPTQTITVTTNQAHGLFKDTPVLVSGITTNITSYNGSFLVSNVSDDYNFTYTATSTPTDPLPSLSKYVNGTVLVESDSVSSASPYIFSCTLRSVYGMNGMHADGSKATGFKSMLVAQFTGISLQKDDNAFILYDQTTGIYNDTLTVSDIYKPLHTNSKAIYKPGYENVHIKTSNNAIIQCVSIFAIGFAKHFVSESGGDQSITNSNSNFGATSLEAREFRPDSFDRDDVGYITHIIPPREPVQKISAVTWLPLDATRIVSTANTARLYLAGYNSADVAPPSQIDSYRIGAKRGDVLYLSVIVGTQQNLFSTPILMQSPSGTPAGILTSSQKVYQVGRSVGVNSVSNNTLTLTENHQLFNGETVRVFSDTGQMPSSLIGGKVYYAYTTGLNANQIQLSSTLNDANSGNVITGISNNGGSLTVISSVSDKQPGDAGHPVQYDTAVGQWYILGSQYPAQNTIYTGIVGIGTSVIGDTTGSAFVNRQIDNRGLEDVIYRLRYVIPKEYTKSRPPTSGFVLQESKTVGVGSASFLSATIEDPTQYKNPKVIVGASYNSGTVTIKTELPHNLVTGDTVTITNIISTNNTVGGASTPYNGTFTVYDTPTVKTFRYVGLSSDPGTFLNQTNQRSTQQQIAALPVVQRKRYNDTLFIYKVSEVKTLIPGSSGQDGIYDLTAVCGSIAPNPNIGFGVSAKRYNQDVRDLYPQTDRDNFNSDPSAAISYADLSILGKVTTNNKANSITKEALNIFLQNARVGLAVTGVNITGSGNTTITLYTNIEHGLNQITSLSLTNAGTGYNNSAGVSSTLYSADLTNNSISGKNASVKATISVGNTISSISIVDGGSAYAIGNTMTISASPAAAPTTYAVVQVTGISNNVGDTLELSGFMDPKYNGVFKILSVPDSRSVQIYNPNGIGNTYISRNDYRYPTMTLVSEVVGVSTIYFTKETGIATVTCSDSHGLLPGNSFYLVGTGNTYFSSKFYVSSLSGVSTATSFTFNAGITTVTQTFNGGNGITLHKTGFSANGLAVGAGEENLGGRGSYIYAGVSTTLSSTITKTSSTLTVPNSGGFRKGDYIIVNAEIMRISADPTTTQISVRRGQFSTVAAAAINGSVIKKIRVLPMEVRRHSILRASGHTFEYLGYGPGNYSTGLPIKQDRILSDDEVIVSQAKNQDGGIVVYTGMNDRGEFYSGATKTNGATGETTIIQAPIVTYFGDDAQTASTTKNSGVFDDIVVKERITIEGGENNNQTSQFYGPVNFSQKVTNTSDNGLETKNLYIKGVASQAKLVTVGIQTPTNASRAGDISLLSTPTPGGFLGHVYADSDWRRFGMISKEKDRDFLTLDQVAIGDSTGVYNFSDALEVNGTVKIKNLYVGGAVTFASNQSFSGVTYDDVTVTDTITFTGTGASTYTLKHPNANSIAQFQNLLVTGYAVTFTNPTVRFENSFNSVYTGVSTVAGTLNIGNLVCAAGILTATEFRGTNVGLDTITVNKWAYVTSGIITNFFSKVGVITSFYSDNGIVTSLTGAACTITTINGTSGFFNGLRANSSLVTPNFYGNVGIITSLSGTEISTYSRANIGIATINNLRIIDWVGGPTAYISAGFVTALTAQWIGGVSGTPIQVNVNSGVITSLTGTAVTYTNIQANTNLVSQGTVYSPVGVVTIMSGTQINLSGIITATQFKSTTAQGSAPLIVASTTQVSNLNASYLQGYQVASTNTASSIVLRDGSGNFNAGTISATQYNGSLQYGLSVNSPLTINATYNNSQGSTIGINATAGNTANYVVQRDGNGDFSARIITATTFSGSLSGGTISGSSLSVSGGITNGGFDFILGNSDQSSRGNSGGSRAFVKDGGAVLVINYAGDFGGGVRIDSGLTVTGDITALTSDMRLKTNIQPIENALDKVCGLSGFTYNWNEIAVNAGFDGSERQLGVSAQEVKEVAPEAIKPAPFDRQIDNETGEIQSKSGENYMTVQYEKLVPLLIESIKELKGELTELRAELDNLKGTK